MFKNRVIACMYTQNPKFDSVFRRFESLFTNDYCKRTLDWSIIRENNKILQFSEVSDIHWNGTLAFWQTFANAFKMYDVEVKWEILAKEIVIDIYNVDSSICIIINFNV